MFGIPCMQQHITTQHDSSSTTTKIHHHCKLFISQINTASLNGVLLSAI
jgi:hypothetical protein